MNKYQKALDRYVNDDYEELQEQFGDSPSTILHTTVKEQQEWDYLLIQEAIDKANKYDEKEKPMKPKLIGKIYEILIEDGIESIDCVNSQYGCPSCHRSVNKKWNHCPKCGGKLDWSGVEEDERK